MNLVPRTGTRVRDRISRRRSRRSVLARLAVVPLAASIAMIAAAGSAQAATPSPSLSIQSASISAGTQPVITYITDGVPSGATIYLQRASGSSQNWQDVGRIQAGSGTVKAPADPAGQWRYRIMIAQGNTAVATSAASTLTVTGSADAVGGNGAPAHSSCTACKVAKAALPWLEQIVAPIAVPVIANTIQSIGEAILDFVGFLFAL
jgi:hypothetical protein